MPAGADNRMRPHCNPQRASARNSQLSTVTSEVQISAVPNDHRHPDEHHNAEAPISNRIRPRTSPPPEFDTG